MRLAASLFIGVRNGFFVTVVFGVDGFVFLFVMCSPFGCRCSSPVVNVETKNTTQCGQTFLDLNRAYADSAVQ